MKMRYEMVICWSEEDNCSLVSFPDFSGQKCLTYGDTYEVAVSSGVEAVKSLVDASKISGKPPPETKAVVA